MRPIKFRGKSIETGEWFYGDLWRREQNGQGTIYTFITHTGGRIERVDPETVGQFTGLSDKNREEIYEGDIVKSGKIKYEIIFSENDFGFLVNYIDEFYSLTFLKGLEDFEIIGNIYDNPNLLTNN